MPPREFTVPVERRTFPGSQSLSLVGDAFGDDANPTALLFHGGGQTRHSWSGTAERLAHSGWYAVSVDLRGHGESGWDPEGAYRSSDFRDDVIEVARAFDRPVLIGASLGGISSLLAVHEAGNAIARALVLVDIATRMEQSGAERIMDFMKDGLEGFDRLEDVADAVAAYNPHRPRPKDISGLEKNLRRGDDGRWHWHWDPAFVTSVGENPFVKVEELERAAAELTIPILLIRGKLSDVVSPEGVERFLAVVPQARFVELSAAGHTAAGDDNDAFTDVVVDFLGAGPGN